MIFTSPLLFNNFGVIPNIKEDMGNINLLNGGEKWANNPKSLLILYFFIIILSPSISIYLSLNNFIISINKYIVFTQICFIYMTAKPRKVYIKKGQNKFCPPG